MSNANSIFGPVNEEIIEDIKRQLHLQGHYLTGTLERSFRNIIIDAENSITLTASAKSYLEQLEYRTPPEKIRLSEAEFQGLRQWTRLRGLATNELEMTLTAAAIVRRWKQVGRTTPSSRVFSQTGERHHAIKRALTNNEKQHNNLLDVKVFGSLDKQFHQTKSGTL